MLDMLEETTRDIEDEPVPGYCPDKDGDGNVDMDVHGGSTVQDGGDDEQKENSGNDGAEQQDENRESDTMPGRDCWNSEGQATTA